MSNPYIPAAVRLAYEDLVWERKVIPTFETNYYGLSLIVRTGGKPSWAVYDRRGALWLRGFCKDLPDGKVKAFNALQSEIS